MCWVCYASRRYSTAVTPICLSLRRPLSSQAPEPVPSSFTKLGHSDEAGATGGAGAMVLRHTRTQEQSRLANQDDALGLFSR
jgi:hypothetical protein